MTHTAPLNYDHGTTGLTVSAQVYESDKTTTVGGSVSLAEFPASSGQYSGTVTLADAGGFIVINDGGADVVVSYPAQVAVEATAQSILTDTAEIGAAGAGLSNIPWNAAWDAEVQSEVTDALNAYDPPTNAEMEARTLPSADYFVVGDYTAPTATGTNQTTIIDALTAIQGSTFDTVTDSLEAIRDRGDSAWTTATGFSTFDPTTDTVTVGTNNDKTGYSITQAFPTNFASLAIDGSGQVTAGNMRGTDDALLATNYTAPDNSSIAAILTDTSTTIPGQITALNNLSIADVEMALGNYDVPVYATLQTYGDANWATATIPTSDITAIKDKTDQLTFTVTGQVDANVLTGADGDDAATIFTYFDAQDLTNFKADVGGLSTFNSTTDQVTVATNNDKTGYSLSASGITAIWSAATRTLTAVADSSGITTLLSRLTSQRAANLDNLDSSISDLQNYGDSNWSTATGFSTHSAADVADAVWDETIADHNIVGSTGLKLFAASTHSASDVWYSMDLEDKQVTVSGYATGQSPSDLVDLSTLDADVTTLLTRVTNDRMAKLDVSGTLANTDNADTFKGFLSSDRSALLGLPTLTQIESSTVIAKEATVALVPGQVETALQTDLDEIKSAAIAAKNLSGAAL